MAQVFVCQTMRQSWAQSVLTDAVSDRLASRFSKRVQKGHGRQAMTENKRYSWNKMNQFQFPAFRARLFQIKTPLRNKTKIIFWHNWNKRIWKQLIKQSQKVWFKYIKCKSHMNFGNRIKCNYYVLFKIKWYMEIFKTVIANARSLQTAENDLQYIQPIVLYA